MGAGANHLTSSIYASFQSQLASRGGEETWTPGQESAWLQPTFQDDQVPFAAPLVIFMSKTAGLYLPADHIDLLQGLYLPEEINGFET